jgi:hypothetical protein
MTKQLPLRKTIIIAALTLLMLLTALSITSPSIRSQSELTRPTITLTPTAAPPGTPITVTGTDFTPGATVDLSWFGYVIQIPGITGILDYSPIATGITVDANGNFTTTIIAPYDFGDIIHPVNATQNGVGTDIVNATFTIVPTLHLTPQPTCYTPGQEILLHVYGGPLGTPAFVMGLSMLPEPTVIKFTYDNTFWGFSTSHLETEGPIVTHGFIGGDIGGNITIRFKAIGHSGIHNIRGFLGGKETPPYLSCEIGGEVEFSIK